MVFYKKYFTKLVILVFLTALFLTSVAVFSVSTFSARAEENETTVFAPLNSEEYSELSSPIHAYSDGEITAVIENNKILFFNGSEAPIIKTGLTSLKQIKRVGKQFFYSDDGNIYTIPTNNLSATPQLLSYTYNEIDMPVGGTFFDTNGEYLVTVFSTNIQIYNISGVPARVKSIPEVKEYSVAVNSTSMFYIANGYICRRDFNDLSNVKEYVEAKPDYMIANEEYVYFTLGKEIYRLSIDDNKSEKLSFNENLYYDLGAVNDPKGLSFKNGNLLITDNSANGSVQEYKIDGTDLEFTGYAIASGLSAFNRVAKTASDIERYGKYVAVLDNYKLTLIDTESYVDETDSHAYNKAAFINKLINNDSKLFALGNGTVMYSKGEKITIAELKKDGSDNANKVKELLAAAPNDIAYQSGYYYIIYLGTNTTVIKVDEKTGEKAGENIIFYDINAKLVTADVFGNVYIADNSFVYKNGTDGVFPFSSAKKLCTDLAGNLFVLGIDGKIYKLNEKTKTFTVAFETALGIIKTFGLNFDRDEMYFLLEDKEEIYYTTGAGNISLNDVKPNKAFTEATTKKNDLAVYTVKNGANVYAVENDGEDFNFNELANVSSEYPLIAKINVSENLDIYALASEKGVVLINKNDLVEKTADFAEAPNKAYVTTAVYAYAIPIIEQQNSFVINDGNTTRFSKGTVATVNSAFTILGKTYYDANVSVNGETLNCYIPADFTATVLAETLEFTEFTIEKVKKTVMYQNSDLSVELIELSDGDDVKLLTTENDALKIIATDSNGVEIVGYIAKESLAENPNLIVRNILIAVAVFASLAGTVSFFLLRKKTLN